MASVQIIDDANIQNPRTCRTCGEVGHIARNCPQKPARVETRDCRICGEVGHIGEYTSSLRLSCLPVVI